jgi:hypothetical protein
MYSAFFDYDFTYERSIEDNLQKRSSSAPPQVLGKQRCAAIDPTSVLHKRHQPVAGLLEPRHKPQSSTEFADCLIVEFVFARASNNNGKRVSAHINGQPGKLERTSRQSLGSSSAVVMPDD